jgi:hypothetical protein
MHCLPDSRGSAGDPEFTKQAGHMGFDRAFRYKALNADFLVALFDDRIKPTIPGGHLQTPAASNTNCAHFDAHQSVVNFDFILNEGSTPSTRPIGNPWLTKNCK